MCGQMGSPLRRDLHWLAARLKIGLHGIEERIAARHGMSLWGYTVLVEVVSGPARTQLALAAAVPVDKTKLVAILDELESSGLVRRRPDPRDRRARLVDPTDAGREACEAASAEIRAVEDDLLSDLEPGERERFVDALQRIVLTRLEDASGHVPGGQGCP
ncbi:MULTISPECIES: MarR family winged helix-turn-helix transcriptional regulator [Nonomuraea]|uniref:MarR family winged helix-turn-helix transcriptional regulator n=2 Tax=Nonomuraea ferruginea TaxID=46174 RepID=A0ABT4SV94_9ACTN|nr:MULTISPECIES: MarR family winged helix-turn-helix transcriptional regulator [Nonomuraea]MDA0640975.1 MarR family winged helix-turn-helix transcriptional regulator [Nonomuraea ferruginea]TXK42867.1 winged helix-turn-helix transcriptional regulator [Nonomuraea sp. C10]